MNKDHQSQNTDQIRTKMLSKKPPITDQKRARKTDANISGQQYQKDNLISNSNIYYFLTEGQHICFNKYLWTRHLNDKTNLYFVHHMWEVFE